MRSASLPFRLLGGVIAGICVWGSAVGDNPADSVLSELARCSAVSGKDERLSCYDTLALHSSGTRRAPPAAAANATSGQSKEEFGLSRVQIQQERPGQQEEIRSVEALVSGFGQSGRGHVVVRLDNGQAWELDRPDPLLASGDRVKIDRATLGSFLLTTPTGRTHHVQRLR
jgi:hypothetical protein